MLVPQRPYSMVRGGSIPATTHAGRPRMPTIPGRETIDLTPLVPGSHDGDVGLPDYVGGWMAQGHRGYHGYAWYRRAVTVPAVRASWDILGPTLVEDGYELYWTAIDSAGRAGSARTRGSSVRGRCGSPFPRCGGRAGCSVRAYKLPGSGAGADAGGMHSAPILAAAGQRRAPSRAMAPTIAGYIVEVIEPIAMSAVIGLAFVPASATAIGFLIFASIALALDDDQTAEQCDHGMD